MITPKQFSLWAIGTALAIFFALLGLVFVQTDLQAKASVLWLLFMIGMWLAFVLGNIVNQPSLFDEITPALRKDIAREYAQAREQRSSVCQK